MMCHYLDLDSAFDWPKKISFLAWLIRCTSQIWVVLHHQYGISAVVSQTSFCAETTDNYCFSLNHVITSLIILWTLSIILYVITYCLGCWFRSNWRSCPYNSTDTDILWTGPGIEPCGAQVQWTSWGTWKLTDFRPWWKWWPQWSVSLFRKLHHL